VLNVTVAIQGQIPRAGLLVSNHLSYLDIVVLAAAAPAVFVAKQEVSAWPVFGWFARAGGTIFVRREQRTSACATNERVAHLLEAGMLVVLFPEGTSTDGQTVLPFRSSLLEPAAAAHSPTTVGCLSYSVQDGDVAEEVCYWRDMTFLPHLLNLLGKAAVEAAVRFQAVPPGTDRKTFARELHRQVLALHRDHRDELPSRDNTTAAVEWI
jgi:1-acyl-sn-glycerol-3-phosphate acyltransferase